MAFDERVKQLNRLKRVSWLYLVEEGEEKINIFDSNFTYPQGHYRKSNIRKCVTTICPKNIPIQPKLSTAYS